MVVVYGWETNVVVVSLFRYIRECNNAPPCATTWKTYFWSAFGASEAPNPPQNEVKMINVTVLTLFWGGLGSRGGSK